MPNILDAFGLQTTTAPELTTDLQTKFKQIYGADINVDSDTPDGQLISVFVQATIDVLDLLTQIFNSFDPDNAIGVVLDQRVAINGIQRQAGTYTVTPITIVVNQSLNLYGLDQTAQPVYTIADNAGNLWELTTTQLGVNSGTHVYDFRAAVPGAQLTIPNTINVPVTIVLGVVSVNNPTTYTTLGINEESDAVLKIRRQKSVSLASQGYYAGLLAALTNINGVSSAYIYENLTDNTNSDGVPGHSIWVIIAGTADASAIANAIYTKRNAGCGMFGSTTYTITQVDGSPFVIFWDSVATQPLFIAFTVSSLNGTTLPNIAAIKTYLVANYVPGVFQEVDINGLATLVQKADSNTLVTGAGFSTGLVQTLAFSAVAASGTFTISYNGNTSAAINWNDSAATIQTNARAVAGLGSVVVTGSIASQSVVFTIPTGVLGLIAAPSNSLLTGGAVAIALTFSEAYANTLTPSSKRNQFVVTADKIVILPMQLLPVTSLIVHATTQNFTALGGYGPNVFSFVANNSGGSINSSSGLYTAGAVTGVTDTVKVTDAFGNTATATIMVT